MEYSVSDLIRILIKKWYVILLTMCALAGLSVFTARRSYAQVVQNYEASVSKTVSAGVDTGTLTATYLYDYEFTDLDVYLTEARRKAAFYERFTQELGVGEQDPLSVTEQDPLSVTEQDPLSAASLAASAYAAFSKQAPALVEDVRVLAETQTAMDAFHYVEPPVLDENDNIVESDEPLTVSNHLEVESLTGNMIRVAVSGLEEQPARELLAAYLRSLEAVGLSDYSIKVSLTERENAFTLAPLRLSQSAQFAKVVMAKPEKTPILVKTVGTAAAYAFVLSCFLILAVTFVQDSRRAEKAGRAS